MQLHSIGIDKGRHVRISSWPGETISTQRPNTLRRPVFSTDFTLAVARPIRHSQDLSGYR